jgi:hypothetical protein
MSISHFTVFAEMTVYVTEFSDGFQLKPEGQLPCSYPPEEALARLVYYYIGGWNVIYE